MTDAKANGQRVLVVRRSGGGRRQVLYFDLREERFGMSWQVVPRVLMEMLQDGDRERSRRA
jgi:predicted 3-demethylubiquinone-9 3-methyltransferase (glyoxalase superfamily)